MLYELSLYLIYAALIAAAVSKHSVFGCIYAFVFVVLYLVDTFNGFGPRTTPRVSLALSAAICLAYMGFKIAEMEGAVKNPDANVWNVIGLRSDQWELEFVPDLFVAVFSIIAVVLQFVIQLDNSAPATYLKIHTLTLQLYALAAAVVQCTLIGFVAYYVPWAMIIVSIGFGFQLEFLTAFFTIILPIASFAHISVRAVFEVLDEAERPRCTENYAAYGFCIYNIDFQGYASVVSIYLLYVASVAHFRRWIEEGGESSNAADVYHVAPMYSSSKHRKHKKSLQYGSGEKNGDKGDMVVETVKGSGDPEPTMEMKMDDQGKKPTTGDVEGRARAASESRDAPNFQGNTGDADRSIWSYLISLRERLIMAILYMLSSRGAARVGVSGVCLALALIYPSVLAFPLLIAFTFALTIHRLAGRLIPYLLVYVIMVTAVVYIWNLSFIDDNEKDVGLLDLTKEQQSLTVLGFSLSTLFFATMQNLARRRKELRNGETSTRNPNAVTSNDESKDALVSHVANTPTVTPAYGTNKTADGRRGILDADARGSSVVREGPAVQIGQLLGDRERRASETSNASAESAKSFEMLEQVINKDLLIRSDAAIRNVREGKRTPEHTLPMINEFTETQSETSDTKVMTYHPSADAKEGGIPESKETKGSDRKLLETDRKRTSSSAAAAAAAAPSGSRRRMSSAGEPVTQAIATVSVSQAGPRANWYFIVPAFHMRKSFSNAHRLCIPIPKSCSVAVNPGHNSRFQWMLQTARVGGVLLSPGRGSVFQFCFTPDKSGRLTIRTRAGHATTPPPHHDGSIATAPMAIWYYLRASPLGLTSSPEIDAKDPKRLFYIYPSDKAKSGGGGIVCLKSLDQAEPENARDAKETRSEEKKGLGGKDILLGAPLQPEQKVQVIPPQEHGLSDTKHGSSPAAIAALPKRKPVCIRAAGRRGRKGPFWSPQAGGHIVCPENLNRPSRKDVFELIHIGNDEKGSFFRIWVPHAKAFLHVLGDEEVNPPRYYLCNKNGNSKPPRRLYVRSAGPGMAPTTFAPAARVSMGIGSDERFLWKIKARQDKLGALESISIRSEVNGHNLEVKYQGHHHKDSDSFLPMLIPGDLDDRQQPGGGHEERDQDEKETRVDVKNIDPIFLESEVQAKENREREEEEIGQGVFRVMLIENGKGRWGLQPVPPDQLKDSFIDWEVLRLRILAQANFFVIWIEVATLLVLYVLAAFTVDLIHAVYLAFFALFIVFAEIRKWAWIAVIFYSAMVVIVLYLYQLEVFSFLQGEIPNFIGIKKIDTQGGWGLLWPHILVFVLSTISWNTHGIDLVSSQRQRRRKQKKALVPLPTSLILSSLLVSLGFGICCALLVVIAITPPGSSDISIISGVYLVLAFVLMGMVFWYPKPLRHRWRLRRLLYIASTYAGFCLVLQYVYQFGVLSFIDDFLSSINLSPEIAGLAQSSNLLAALAIHSLILFSSVLQIRVSNAHYERKREILRRKRARGHVVEEDKDKDNSWAIGLVGRAAGTKALQKSVRRKTERELLMTITGRHSVPFSHTHMPPPSDSLADEADVMGGAKGSTRTILWAIYRFLWRICVLHTDKALFATMFWASTTNPSLFGLWRLLVGLWLISFSFIPNGPLCRLQTFVILTTEMAILATMYLYNLLQSVIHNEEELSRIRNCGPPPLQSEDCPEEAILGIWLTSDFGGEISLSVTILFLTMLHAISKHQLSLVRHAMLTWIHVLRKRAAVRILSGSDPGIDPIVNPGEAADNKNNGNNHYNNGTKLQVPGSQPHAHQDAGHSADHPPQSDRKALTPNPDPIVEAADKKTGTGAATAGDEGKAIHKAAMPAELAGDLKDDVLMYQRWWRPLITYGDILREGGEVPPSLNDAYICTANVQLLRPTPNFLLLTKVAQTSYKPLTTGRRSAAATPASSAPPTPQHSSSPSHKPKPTLEGSSKATAQSAGETEGKSPRRGEGQQSPERDDTFYPRVPSDEEDSSEDDTEDDEDADPLRAMPETDKEGAGAGAPDAEHPDAEQEAHVHGKENSRKEDQGARAGSNGYEWSIWDRVAHNQVLNDMCEMASHFTEQWSLQISTCILAWVVYDNRSNLIGLVALVWICVILRFYGTTNVWLGVMDKEIPEDSTRLWLLTTTVFELLFVAEYCIFIYWIRRDQQGYSDASGPISRTEYINIMNDRMPDLWGWLHYFQCTPSSASATNRLLVDAFLIFFLACRYRNLCRSRTLLARRTDESRRKGPNVLPPSVPVANPEDISWSIRRDSASLNKDKPIGDGKNSLFNANGEGRSMGHDLRQDAAAAAQANPDAYSIASITTSRRPSVIAAKKRAEGLRWYADLKRDFTILSTTPDFFLRFFFRDFENINKIIILGLGSGFFNVLNLGYMMFTLFLLRLTGENKQSRSTPLWGWLAAYNIFVLLLRICFQMPWNRYLPGRQDDDVPPFTWPEFFGLYYSDWKRMSMMLATDVGIMTLVAFQNYLKQHPRIRVLTIRQSIERSEEEERGRQHRAKAARLQQEKIEEFELSKKERRETLERLRDERRLFRQAMAAHRTHAARGAENLKSEAKQTGTGSEFPLEKSDRIVEGRSMLEGNDNRKAIEPIPIKVIKESKGKKEKSKRGRSVGGGELEDGENPLKGMHEPLLHLAGQVLLHGDELETNQRERAEAKAEEEEQERGTAGDQAEKKDAEEAKEKLGGSGGEGSQQKGILDIIIKEEKRRSIRDEQIKKQKEKRDTKRDAAGSDDGGFGKGSPTTKAQTKRTPDAGVTDDGTNHGGLRTREVGPHEEDKGRFVVCLKTTLGTMKKFFRKTFTTINEMAWGLTTLTFTFAYAFDPSIFTALYPISLFSYVAMVSPRVHTSFWNVAMVYTVAVIILLYAFQLPLFCVCECNLEANEKSTYEIVWTCQEMAEVGPQGQEVRRCQDSPCGNTEIIDFWGLRKVDDDGGAGFTFFKGAFWYFAVLLALLNQRYWLRKNGLWDKPRSETKALVAAASDGAPSAPAKAGTGATQQDAKDRDPAIKNAKQGTKSESGRALPPAMLKGVWGRDGYTVVTEDNQHHGHNGANGDGNRKLDPKGAKSPASSKRRGPSSGKSAKAIVNTGPYGIGPNVLISFDQQWIPARILGLYEYGTPAIADKSRPKSKKDLSSSSRKRTAFRSSRSSKATGDKALAPKAGARRGGEAGGRIISVARAAKTGFTSPHIVISFQYLSHDQRKILRPKHAPALLAPQAETYMKGRQLLIAEKGRWRAAKISHAYSQSVEVKYVEKGNVRRKILRKQATLEEKNSIWSRIFGSGQSGQSGFVKDSASVGQGLIQKIYNRSDVSSKDVGEDLYGYSLSIQVIIFFVVLIFYNKGEEFTTGFAESRVSSDYVYSIFAIFFWICVDRVIYLYRSLLAKLIEQLISVGVTMGLLLQSGSLSSFQVAVFLLIAAFWAVSASQFRKGYPAVILPSLLKPHWFLGTLFSGYRAIPFVFELRTLLDWSCNDTVLFLGEWLKLEDLWVNFFLVQCDLSWKRVSAQVPGIPQRTCNKCFQGWLIFLLLVLVVWGPLFLFVGGPRVALNISQVSISAGIPGYVPFTSTDQVERYSVSDEIYSVWRADFNFINNEDRSSLRSYSTTYPQAATQWQIVPTALDQLLSDLSSPDADPIFQVSISFLKQTTSNFQSSNVYTFAQAMPEESQQNLFSILSAARVGETSVLPGNVTIPNCYPFFLYLPSGSSPDALSTAQNALLNCTLIVESVGNYSTGAGRLWLYFLGPEVFPSSERATIPNADVPTATFTLADGTTRTYQQSSFQTFSDTLINIGEFSVGLIPLYIGFVYTIGQFVRLLVTGASANIIYKDLGDAGPFLALIKFIYLARADGQLDLEEFLYVELINILRSPQLILKMSGDYTRVFPTRIYARRVLDDLDITSQTKHKPEDEKKVIRAEKDGEGAEADQGRQLLNVGSILEIRTDASTKIRDLKALIAQHLGDQRGHRAIEIFYKGQVLEEQSDKPGRRPHNNVADTKDIAPAVESKAVVVRRESHVTLYDNRIYDYAINFDDLVQFYVIPKTDMDTPGLYLPPAVSRRRSPRVPMSKNDVRMGRQDTLDPANQDNGIIPATGRLVSLRPQDARK